MNKATITIRQLDKGFTMKTESMRDVGIMGYPQGHVVSEVACVQLSVVLEKVARAMGDEDLAAYIMMHGRQSTP